MASSPAGREMLTLHLKVLAKRTGAQSLKLAPATLWRACGGLVATMVKKITTGSAFNMDTHYPQWLCRFSSTGRTDVSYFG